MADRLQRSYNFSIGGGIYAVCILGCINTQWKYLGELNFCKQYQIIVTCNTLVLRGVYSDTTQLNSTELNWPSWTAYSQVSRVFVYDVTTYKLSQLLFTLSSWVELCRYGPLVPIKKWTVRHMDCHTSSHQDRVTNFQKLSGFWPVLCYCKFSCVFDCFRFLKSFRFVHVHTDTKLATCYIENGSHNWRAKIHGELLNEWRGWFAVTISSPTGSTFKGFLLQAKTANGRNAGQTVGTFHNPPRHSAMKLSCNRVCI